jgi:hypothetical protein
MQQVVALISQRLWVRVALVVVVDFGILVYLLPANVQRRLAYELGFLGLFAGGALIIGGIIGWVTLKREVWVALRRSRYS